MEIYSLLKDNIIRLNSVKISDERIRVLSPLIEFINSRKENNEQVNLNFICTHNSRRSQLAQVWADMAAQWYAIEANCFSGGVEVTAFNINAINTLREAGFTIKVDEGANPTCFVKSNKSTTALHAFSKLYDHEINPKDNFAAIMTCSDAEENCPFIPGTEQRIALLYEDPKVFDGTPQQSDKYKERSEQIGAEMLYVFRNSSV